MPFHGTKGLHLAFSIVNGTRPAKPENATAIGLSDPVWELLQACWNEDRSLRPQIQHVEVQVGNAATRWRAPMQPRSPVPLSPRPGDSEQNTLVFPASHSSTGTRNSSASDLPRLNVPIIRVDVVGPEESSPHRMQEFYPPPSPISPNQSGSHSNETLINRLDGVSPRVVRLVMVLMPGLASRTGFHSRTGKSENAEQAV